ncbi:lysoplasmalogenase [Parvibaculum sp.]|uniref:lysoplasmalogenase n=1 Tax=Parvibaculum sp. TaxID=2024848 RepID=UPI00320C1893
MFNAALTFADGLDTIRWGLAAVSLLTSLAYLVVVDKPASTLRTTLKTAAIGAFVPLPLLDLGGDVENLSLVALAAAFLLCSFGDYFLALDDEEKNFPRGLGSFLLAHVFYLVVLVPHATTPQGFYLAGIALLAVLSAGTLAWLWPVLGKLRLPVLAYMAVISAMAVAAFSVPLPWLGVGALLFVFSDAVIAVSKFRYPVPFRGAIVWITYYVGQALIALSLLAALR